MAKKTKSSLGVVFWIALLVFLILLYMANRLNFSDILGGSGVSGVVEGIFGGDYRSGAASDNGVSPWPETQETASPPPEEAAPLPAAQRDTPKVSPPAAAPVPRVPAPPQSPPPSVSAASETSAPPPRQTEQTRTPAPSRTESGTQASQTNAAAETAPPPPETVPKTRNAVLYFIRLSGEGEVSLVKAAREIHTRDTPLTDTLRALTAGPSQEEQREGYTSLIPPESRLLSATVKDGVAIINFNEDFRFNSLGKEGYDGQLKQTVYTVTEFPNVQAVQFLINGKEIDYLGSEGVYIGRPVRRDSF
jgi:spore germination protein GerM